MDIAKHTRSLFVAALLAFGVLTAGIALAACGDDDGSDSGAASTTEQSAGSGVDLAFVRDMIPHHESAVEMAEIARTRGESAFVKDLAEDIIRTQTSEITTLNAIGSRLAARGVRPGDLGVPSHAMGMGGDVAMLRTAEPFDRAFIDMMIPHHQGAIRMGRAELAKGESGEAKRLAEEIIAAQAREITAMNAHREEAFGAASPAGGVPEAGSAAKAPEAEGSGEGHGGGHGG